MCPAPWESYTAAVTYSEGHNKSDTKTKKWLWTARHFHNKYSRSSNSVVYLCVQLIEKVTQRL